MKDDYMIKQVKMKRVSNDNILSNYLISLRKNSYRSNTFSIHKSRRLQKNNHEKYSKADASLYRDISSSSLISDDL